MRHFWFAAALFGVLYAGGHVQADEKAPATRVDRYGDPLPPGAIARLGTMRWRHPTIIWDMAFSPDGKELTVAGYDKAIRYYDMEGRLLRALKIDVEGFAGSPFGTRGRSLAIAPDRKTAAVLGFVNGLKTPYFLKCVELPSGKEITSLSAEKSFGEFIEYLPDSRTAVTYESTGRIRFWDLLGGTEILDAKPLEGHLSVLSASSDGSTLALSISQKDAQDIYLWKWLEDEKPSKLITRRAAETLAFSPDGKWLAISEFARRPADYEGRRYAISYGVRLYDLVTGKAAKEFPSLDGRSPDSALAFSADGKRLAVINAQRRGVMVRDVAAGKELQRFDVWPDYARSVAFSPDGRLLAIGSDEAKPLVVRNLETGERLGPAHAAHSASVGQAVFLAREETVVTADSSGVLMAWEARSGRRLWESRHRDPSTPKSIRSSSVRAIAASPDGKLLVTSCYDDTVRLWNAATGKEIFRLAGHGSYGLARTQPPSLPMECAL